MSAPLRLGIVGCGVIAHSYLHHARLFPGIEVVACADQVEAAARARAEAFSVRCDSVDGLLGASDVDLVVNLTPPDAHFDVSMAALRAGKHVHTEKPLADSVERGRALLDAARERGLRVGAAPDTLLGGGAQSARALIDAGRIGRVVGGTCHVLGPGPESWHPNPDFFFQPGGGPMLDMGPYYVTCLVNLIGPVARVTAAAGAAHERRTVGSGPRAGETVPVDTPTTVHSVLEFEMGALVTLGASFDVRRHGHANVELYGTQGSIVVPDPNFFGGEARLSERGGAFGARSNGGHPFAAVSREMRDGAMVADYRIAGVADLAAALVEQRPHRCSGALALHVLEVLEASLRSAREGRAVDIETRCERPAALSASQAAALMEATP